VPQSHWAQLLTALRPARRDNYPASWQVLGTLKLTCKGHKQFLVELFNTDGPGAFAAGETFESRVYYRGGDSAKLKEALKQARLDTIGDNLLNSDDYDKFQPGRSEVAILKDIEWRGSGPQ
jgi:hypothetical protein